MQLSFFYPAPDRSDIPALAAAVTFSSHLENLACGYWGSEVFFTALNFDLFSKLGAGTNNLAMFAKGHDFDQNSSKRLMQALEEAAKDLLAVTAGYILFIVVDVDI